MDAKCMGGNAWIANEHQVCCNDATAFVCPQCARQPLVDGCHSRGACSHPAAFHYSMPMIDHSISTGAVAAHAD